MLSKNKSNFFKKLLAGSFFYTLAAIIIGFLCGAIALIIAGFNPITSYGILFQKIFGSPKLMSYSFIEYATPYILTGLSVAFSFKTGIFNIGAEGQYVMGSVAAALIGIFVKAPAWILVPLCLLSGIVIGALLGALVGWLKVRFGVNEVLSMIMFNWIAYYFSNFIVNTPWAKAGQGKTWTLLIQDAAKINIPAWKSVLSPKVHYGIFIAIIAVIVIYYIIEKTTLGFRLKAVGYNRSAAEFAGISANREVMIALAISGCLAGLAGAIQVQGVTYKLDQFAGQEGYGFNGITVALIGSTNPFGVLLAGLFFGMMRFGGSRFGAPSEVVDIIMGIIVFFIAISNLLRETFNSSKKEGGID